MITSGPQINQVIDSLEEAEAECFAAFFLVPWEAFYKGTFIKHLAEQFGEQQSAIEYFERFTRQPAVKNEFCKRLWQSGVKRHSIFDED